MPRFHLPFQRRHRYRKRSTVRMNLALIFLVFAIALFTPLYIVYKPPNVLIRYFQRRWPDVLWYVPTQKKVVALTIDDAPSQHTSEIMDVLKAYNATATFFVIGSQAAGQQERLADLVKAGHELGNHAMHDEPSKSLTDDELTRQVGIVQKIIAAAYDAAGIVQPTQRGFRPGSGFFSSGMRRLMAKLGHPIVLGSVYPHDPQIPYATVNARHVLSMVRPGSIIICHDRRAWTAPMLRIVLPELKKRGYQVHGLSSAKQLASG